jgi:hypothetical protein
MGSAARIITAVLTGGTSEVAREAGKQTGIDPRIINPLAAGYDKGLATVGVKDKSHTALTPQLAKPGMTQDEIDREARLARDQRRKDYQNLGRSGTILTGPGGLGGTGTGEQKTLLGY